MGNKTLFFKRLSLFLSPFLPLAVIRPHFIYPVTFKFRIIEQMEVSYLINYEDTDFSNSVHSSYLVNSLNKPHTFL